MSIEDIYQGMQGQTLVIPDLRPLYSKWSTAVNPHYVDLVQEVDTFCDRWVLDKTLREKYRAADLAFFTAAIYPHADWDRLRTMALFTVAVFAMDDSIDKEIEGGPTDLAADFFAASELRKDCVAFMRQQLFPTPGFAPEFDTPREFAGFSVVAPILAKCDPKQLSLPMLAKDLENFIESTEPEQLFKLTGKVPTIGEYWSFRHSTGAVLAFSTLHQYAVNTYLPVELAWCEEVMTMRTEASFQPCVCNDLFSLKKEMKEVAVTNLIPIAIKHSNKSLDEAVSDLIEQLYASAERFDAATTSLRMKGQKYNMDVQRELDRFIEAFETFQTGCFQFYLRSKRFRILNYKQSDGSFVIPL